MAESNFPLPPDGYTCLLCADMLRDPVTISCGDTYCLECIKIYWDQYDHLGVYSCPQCRATFSPRPVLRRNVPNRDSLCDFCTGHLDRKICPQHQKGLELFCRSDQMCICVLYKRKNLAVTQSEVQHIIQEQMKELQELRHNVNVLKSNAQRVISDSDKIFSEMLQAVERWHAEVSQLTKANMQVAMSQAEGYVERLEQEILELQRKDVELRQILDTEDNIHFLQNFPTLCVPPEPMVPKVLINPQFSFGEITKTATDMKEHLDDICKKELSKISKLVSDTPVYILSPRGGDKQFKAPSRADFQEPKTRADFLRYSCPLTFDPNTAYKELVLFEGNHKVMRKKTVQFYPDHPERFDGFSQVLCRESLGGFRYYWEAEWSGEFSIGVAYKSISRKSKNSHSLLGYNDKSWSLLCSDSGYSAWHNKMDKDLPEAPRATRVGVYLDYTANTVAFYSVSEAMELIHKFKAQFSEPLYAGFGVGSSVSLCQLKENLQPYRAQ
ncbi:unnamed protein product [Oncorhynchus mykiss]|uniref:Tripartite motif-containing protein 16-like n=1 Tax=Oncorhynchus mykiss TaxID=8022 RepID=A0A060VVB6_ONCMY|nr:unnamed protein product [Oncorhynchus mykiss]